MTTKSFPLTAASFPVSALAAVLALSACAAEADTSSGAMFARSPVVSSACGAALIAAATHPAPPAAAATDHVNEAPAVDREQS